MQKFIKAKVEAERRVGRVRESRYSIDWQSAFLYKSIINSADHAISNVLVLGKDLNIFQHESDLGIISSRIVRASRGLQFDAQQRKPSNKTATRKNR